MKTIHLAGGDLLIDDADFELVRDLRIHVSGAGYAVFETKERGKNGRPTKRYLHNLFVGKYPTKCVDHIDGNKLNNQRANLRVVTQTQNQANRKQLQRNNTSGVRGVTTPPQLSRDKPWLASITFKGKCIHLGVFATQEEAVAARKAAELKYFGELCPPTGVPKLREYGGMEC